MGKVCALGWPFQSDQKQSIPLPLMLSTVINGPPNVAEQDHHAVMGERSSAAMLGGDGAGSEKAGIEGRQSATPKAIAVRMRFVNEHMLNSTSSGADIGDAFR
jgi:hypothetical protein